MRILQLVQKPQRRGAEVFAFQLSRELRRNLHEVRIAYLYPYEGPNGLPLEASDTVLGGREENVLEKLPGINPRLSRRLKLLIADFRPDVVQSNGARTVKYGAFAHCRNPHRDWALVYRNIGNPQDWVRGWTRRFFYKQMVMRRVDGVVGVSRVTLERLMEFYHLSVPAVHIPRGVDTSLLKPQVSREILRQQTSTPSHSYVLLYVGSLTREKRPDRFLRIVSTLNSKLPDIQAWVVGDGPLKTELETEAKSSGLENVMHFLGVQEDVASFMAAADLLLLTSDTEGIPGAVLEAGFLRLPVVATDVGGLRECVIDNKTGVLVQPDDEEAFAQVVMRLLKHDTERQEMGERAKDWVETNFEISRISSKYLQFYSYLLSETGKQPLTSDSTQQANSRA